MSAPTLQKIGVFALAVLVAFVVLNRWMVTDIGLLSYGRVWQLFISYEDFGFVRRAFMGTAFSVTGLNTLVENEYFFALAVHHVAVLGFAATILLYTLKAKTDDIALIATIALSPALIIQSGYTTGSLDIFVLTLAALNMLFVRNNVVFCTILVVGVFIHELCLFTVPAQLAAYHVRTRPVSGPVSGYHAIPPILCAGIALGATQVFGTSDLPAAVFEAIMADKIPNAVDRHALWSGYFEVSRSAFETSAFSLTVVLQDIRQGFVYLALPLLYVALVTTRLAFYAPAGLQRMTLVFSALFPLSSAFVATDLYRWIGMSASMGLLLTLVLASEQRGVGRSLTYALLPFSLLAPFGAAQIDWPFPMLQYLLEKIGI